MAKKDLKKLSYIKQNVDNAKVTGFSYVELTLNYTAQVKLSLCDIYGKYVAYTNQVNGKQSIWLRHLETANNTLLMPPSDDVYYGLAVSNDGETLFFTRRVREGNDFMSIYRIPIFGGVPVKIAENVQGWISVSPDDRQISFVRYEKGLSEFNKLMIIDVDGKNERKVKVSENSKSFWATAFSLDGKTIAAVYGHTRNASQQIGLSALTNASDSNSKEYANNNL